MRQNVHRKRWLQKQDGGEKGRASPAASCSGQVEVEAQSGSVRWDDRLGQETLAGRGGTVCVRPWGRQKDTGPFSVQPCPQKALVPQWPCSLFCRELLPVPGGRGAREE